MNLAQASMQDLHAAFDVDMRQFLAQFDGAVEDACGARDAQALGAAGEALRGIRLGAEFLGFAGLSRVCREVEQELLRQLPLLASRDADAAERVRELASTLREAVGSATASAPPRAGIESVAHAAPEPEGGPGVAPKLPETEAPPGLHPEPAAVAEAQPEPELEPEPEPEPEAEFEPEAPVPVSPGFESQPPQEAAVQCRWDAQEASQLLRQAVEPLQASLQQTHDLLRDHVQGWGDMRDALLQAIVTSHEAEARPQPVQAACDEPPVVEAFPVELPPVEEPAVETPSVEAHELAPPLAGELLAGPPPVEAPVDKPPTGGAGDAESVPADETAWDGVLDVRLAQLGDWMLALPADSVLGHVDAPARTLRLPRGETLVLSEFGALPEVGLEQSWGMAEGPDAGESYLLVREERDACALRVQRVLDLRTLHFWSIPSALGGALGVAAAAVLDEADSTAESGAPARAPALALLLDPGFLRARHAAAGDAADARAAQEC